MAPRRVWGASEPVSQRARKPCPGLRPGHVPSPGGRAAREPCPGLRPGHVPSPGGRAAREPCPGRAQRTAGTRAADRGRLSRLGDRHRPVVQSGHGSAEASPSTGAAELETCDESIPCGRNTPCTRGRWPATGHVILRLSCPACLIHASTVGHRTGTNDASFGEPRVAARMPSPAASRVPHEPMPHRTGAGTGPRPAKAFPGRR